MPMEFHPDPYKLSIVGPPDGFPELPKLEPIDLPPAVNFLPTSSARKRKHNEIVSILQPPKKRKLVEVSLAPVKKEHKGKP